MLSIPVSFEVRVGQLPFSDMLRRACQIPALTKDSTCVQLSQSREPHLRDPSKRHTMPHCDGDNSQLLPARARGQNSNTYYLGSLQTPIPINLS